MGHPVLQTMKLESVYYKFLGKVLEVRFMQVREEIYNLTNSDIYIVVNALLQEILLDHSINPGTTNPSR